MQEAQPKPLDASDATKTYRYLRIGMLLAVVLLGVSIYLEHSKTSTGCWQTSISAYYYTPVRSIFVGGMMAVGFALIVIKGRGLEDVFLNISGMLAPVVASVPITDVGDCWSIAPEPLPILRDGSPAPWVVSNIDNNVQSLLWIGAIGLVFAAGFAIRNLQRDRERVTRGTWVSLAITAAMLVAGTAAYAWWDSFKENAHGIAAYSLFGFLILAVFFKALTNKERQFGYVRWYWAIGGAMVLGAVAIQFGGMFGNHTTFALEAYEIALFALYWAVQTRENWNETLASELEGPDDQ